MEFEHKVSKGSRFNQIYIPKEMESIFEVGDVVKVKLLKKRNGLFYSKGLQKIGEFKEKLVKDVFSFFGNFHNIKQVFVVGSFLVGKIDYKNIDLIIIINKKSKDLEEKIYNCIIQKFQLKFHLIIIQEDHFSNLLKICPLTKSMFYYYISNKKFEIMENEMNKVLKLIELN